MAFKLSIRVYLALNTCGIVSLSMCIGTINIREKYETFSQLHIKLLLKYLNVLTH